MKPTTPVVEEVSGELVPDEQPSGSELVLTDTDRHTVMTLLDRHDEALIMEELQRRSLKVMLYSFPLDGHDVVDLSYLGVNEAVRVMNDKGLWQITIDPDRLTVESSTEDLGEGPEPCWTATVYSINRRSGYGQFGTYVQPKRMKLTDANKIRRRREKGGFVDDDNRIADKFSRQKSLSKAQRNALKIHIPEEVRQLIIAQYKGDDQAIRHIQAGAGAEQLAELPPPLTDQKALDLKAAARNVFDQIRELDPLKVLPAAFHNYLTRAEHSHERLEDFIGFLNGKLDEAKAANNG